MTNNTAVALFKDLTIDELNVVISSLSTRAHPPLPSPEERLALQTRLIDARDARVEARDAILDRMERTHADSGHDHAQL